MKVVTCISDIDNPGYRRFLEPSCNYYNFELIPLEYEGIWLTNRNKDKYLMKYLKDIDPGEIVMFSDGYDTMLLCSESEILEKYRKFGKPLVFSAEKNCWPDQTLSKMYPPSPTQFRYINCGGFLGKAGTIRSLLETYATTPSHYNHFQKKFWKIKKSIFKKDYDPDFIYKYSNQYYWTHVFFRNTDKIALDCHSEIFLELTTILKDFPAEVSINEDEIEKTAIYKKEKNRIENECIFEGNRLIYGITNSKPCHLHFNGQIIKKIAFNGHFDNLMPWQIRAL